MKKDIFDNFHLTNEEEIILDNQFGDLCYYAAWELYRRNTKNNHIHDVEDLIQELKFSIVIAGCYYKRQTYIESCLSILDSQLSDDNKSVLCKLQKLWSERTRHGANKQKFGPVEEKILDSLVKKHIAKKDRPNKNNISLVFDSRFATYCKHVMWNAQKTIGRKITKEKPIRIGMASLSEYDYLGSSKLSKLCSTY